VGDSRITRLRDLGLFLPWNEDDEMKRMTDQPNSPCEPRLTAAEVKAAMAGSDSESWIEASTSRDGQGAADEVFDNYRSLGDSNLMIFVAKNVVPPFRFKAGGWELMRSSIELGPAMKARVAEKGYFMFRANEDQTDWVELSDPETPFAEPGPMAKAK
jgi:hypothetical protein